LERARYAWDNGSEGNYWSNYNGTDSNNDGIGDTYFIISDGVKDNYPLMKASSKNFFFVNVLTPYGMAKGSYLYKAGSRVTISISQTLIDYTNCTRRVFKGWYEGNLLVSDKQNFSITVNRSIDLVANWEKEYKIEVVSNWGRPTGSGWYGVNSAITVSIDETSVNHGNGTRRIFNGWYESNSLIYTDQKFSLVVDRPRKILADWDTEYEVKVLNGRGNITGSGWYKVGATATISISSIQIEEFFANYVFKGWKVNGIFISTSPTYSFVVNRPTTLTAIWEVRLNTVNLIVTVAFIIIVAIILTVILLRKRRRDELEVKIKKVKEFLEGLEEGV
jgi:hypothetical protein